MYASRDPVILNKFQLIYRDLQCMKAKMLRQATLSGDVDEVCPYLFRTRTR